MRRLTVLADGLAVVVSKRGYLREWPWPFAGRGFCAGVCLAALVPLVVVTHITLRDVGPPFIPLAFPIGPSLAAYLAYRLAR